ncbi:uncharacterized protein LOC108915074, partial [Anoplophora glabripennis]|uniref:uncharacterized protein LOC108915074 n=1 Tax=Anoplophora glabripennis TaxID=217634 RepID=UPI000873DEC3
GGSSPTFLTRTFGKIPRYTYRAHFSIFSDKIVQQTSCKRLTVKLTNSEVNRAFSLISHWLCYANSAVNPIIYNFMSGKFRKEFRRAFDSCCQREHEDRNYYKYGGTFCHKLEKDSVLASQSRTDFEIHRLNTYKDYDTKLTRKGTKTSVLQVEI